MISLPIFGGWKPKSRYFLCGVALIPVFAIIHFVAFWLRFEEQVYGVYWTLFAGTVFKAVLVKLMVFGWFRVHYGWGRYVTFHDLVTLIKATTIASLCLVLAEFVIRPGFVIPRSVLLLDWGLTIVLIGGLLSAVRFLRENARPSFFLRGETPVFIVGANDSGEALLRAIRRSSKLSYRVVGFLTDDATTVRSHIAGVPVIGVLEQMSDLVQSHGVEQVLITAGELPGQRVRSLVEQASRAGVTVTVLPSYEQLIRGSVDLRPRQVSIEDLLHRDPVRLDQGELHRWLAGRVLLVTGSAGSIGSEICRQLLQFCPERLIALDRSETGQFFLERELRSLAPEANIEVCLADINDRRRMDVVFRHFQPDIVFHAAAYKHVPLMEQHPGEAVKNITLATQALADLAEKRGVSSFVMISTDKAVNPTSVMGTCKRIAELYVQARAEESRCQFVTVRFGNVLDSAGSVIPVFREQIAHGGPVTVTHPEMERFFMTIPEASQLVIQAGAMGRGGEIFVLDMGQPVRIVDLANDMIRLSGLKVGDDIEIVYSGIRPGEKLFEELHCDGERHLRTSHPKIMVAESEEMDLAVLQGSLEFLREIADQESESTLVRVLHELVPQHGSLRPGGASDRETRPLHQFRLTSPPSGNSKHVMIGGSGEAPSLPASSMAQRKAA